MRFNSFGNSNWENIFSFVKNQLTLIPIGETLLEVGAGEQKWKKYCTHLNYKSQDICQYKGGDLSSGMHEKSWNTDEIDIVSDICNMPLPDNSVDNILCTEVLEHVHDPIKALNEIYRVLKPGGKLILTVPSFSLIHFAPYHFYTGFTRYFCTDLLDNLGFKVLEFKKSGNILTLAAHLLSYSSHITCSNIKKMPRFLFVSYTITILVKIYIVLATVPLIVANKFIDDEDLSGYACQTLCVTSVK